MARQQRKPQRGVTDVPPDRTNIYVSIGVVIGVLITLWGLPGFLAVAISFSVAGFLAQYPQLTGGNTKSPQPGSEYERKEITKFQRRRDWRVRILVPNPDWITLWPIKGAFVFALGLAAVAAAIPVAYGSTFVAGVNAYAAFAIASQYSASRRRHRLPGEEFPPLLFDKTFLASLSTAGLPRLWTKFIGAAKAKWASLATGVVACGISGFIFFTIAGVILELTEPLSEKVIEFSAKFDELTAPVVESIAESFKFEASDFSLADFAQEIATATSPMAFTIALCAFGAILPILVIWIHKTTDEVVNRYAAKIEWEPHWESMKFDPAPRLVSREIVGPLTIDTFGVPPGKSTADFFDKEAAILPSIGSGRDIIVAANRSLDGQGQPITGSIHPSEFRVGQWDTAERPNLNDPALDFTVAETFMNLLIAPAARRAAIAEPMYFDTLQPLHGEGSSVAAYRAESAATSPELHLFLRRAAAGIPIGSDFKMPLVINHRPGKDGGLAFYFGNTADPGFVGNDFALEPVAGSKEGKNTVDIIADLNLEDYWDGLWVGTDKVKEGKVPVFPHDSRARTTMSLASGIEVTRQLFQLRSGQSHEDLFGIEPNFRSTAMRTPFASVTGVTTNQSDRPGERRDGKVYLTYVPLQSSEGKPQMNASVPTGPQTLNPPAEGRGQRYIAESWILAGRINEAFDTLRMSRPEVVSARPLTAPNPRGQHIWEVRLRLYGSVTYDNIREKASKLRERLGDAQWLRVGYDRQLAVLYMGADPNQVPLANEDRDRDLVVGLDWENAFNVSKIVGDDGSLPKLVSTSVMPENDNVRKIEFTLPPGISTDKVKGSISKLTGVTGMGYISVTGGSDPSKFLLTVARNDPMPRRVSYDFDNPVDDKGRFNFGVRVDGSSVWYDPIAAPHIMFMGTSGSGKSATGQSFAYSAIASGCDVIFADAQKEAADFQFAESRALTIATTVADVRAALEYAYSETRERVRMNSMYGAANFMDPKIPDEVRPRPIFIFIDEFNGLIDSGARPSTKAEPDPDAERDRLASVADYEDRNRIAFLSNKIAAEARSAGLHLIVMGQKFDSRLMDKAKSLKTNAARLLQGKTSAGDRASALRDPWAAPDLGEEVPKGRAIWESVDDPAEAFQARFAEADDYERGIEAIAHRLHPVEKIDLEAYRPKRKNAVIEGEEIPEGEAIYDGEIDLGNLGGDDEEDVDVTVSDDGELDLSALLGTFASAPDDDDEEETPAEETEAEPAPAGLDFGDEDGDEGPSDLDFGGGDEPEPDEPETDGPTLSFGDEDDEAEAAEPELSFDDEPSEPEADEGLVFGDEEEVAPVVDEPEPVSLDEPETIDGEEELSGDIVIVGPQALTTLKALPGSTETIKDGRNSIHVFTDAIRTLEDTGARVVVTPDDEKLVDIIGSAEFVEPAQHPMAQIEEILIAPASRVAIIGVDFTRDEKSEIEEMFSDCDALVISASGRAGVSVAQLNRVVGHFSDRHSQDQRRRPRSRPSV